MPMRKLALLASLVLLVVAIAAPASATKPGTDPQYDDGHKIWICHATRSLSNPYVKIHIDIAAWDVEDPDSTDHGPGHHAREKQGVEWADYALGHPDAECVIDSPPPGLICPWTKEPADFVVAFPAIKLIASSRENLTVDAAIPAGTYDVLLVSGDFGRGGAIVQDNEQWRLRGGAPGAYVGTPSGYTWDLADVPDPISGEFTNSTVKFDAAIVELTAEHWNANPENTSLSADSVVPEGACFTDARD